MVKWKAAESGSKCLKLLYSWSIDWQMVFNTDKCKVVHFGYNNTAADYSLGDVNIQTQSVKEEKDLGLLYIRH